MPLLPEKSTLDTFRVWNRKGHYYLGLYFLFFLWLYSFTGLLLNHGNWSFADFWPTRKVSKITQQIVLPSATTDLDQARDVMRQLNVTGEIEWPSNQPDPSRFDFRVNRPGHNFAISISRPQGLATLEHTEVNNWGVLRTLHSFTGARPKDKINERDWFFTTLWALSMDAVSIGLIVMVASGIYLWWCQRTKRLLGAICLLLGTISCALFVFGIRWLFA